MNTPIPDAPSAPDASLPSSPDTVTWKLYVWADGSWRTDEDDDLSQAMEQSDDYRTLTMNQYCDPEDVEVVAEMASNGASDESIKAYLDNLASLPR